MFHSMKLCADKLSDITTTLTDSATTTATAAVASSLPVPLLVVNPASTLPTPVAHENSNTNSNVCNNNNLNSAITNTTATIASIVKNSNINNGIVHRQQHQHQGRYLDTTSGVKFHPYLRQASVVSSENFITSAQIAGTSAFVATLFPAPATTTISTAANAITSPSGLVTLPTKQQTFVSSSHSTVATYGNGNNYTVVKMKSEVMSEGEEANESFHNTGATNNAALTLSDTNKNACTSLVNFSHNNSGNNSNSGTPDISNEFSKEQPDSDNIKMFVGQIPKTWDETQLLKLFEPYGRIHNLNVLRDKMTSTSRGCCFVTYYTRKAALKAQDALHNIKTLEGMHHPIQMKPADSENRNERKLFVGMLNKKYNEADVRQLFTGHGTIEECTVLRDQNGQSKGCAFVTFATKHNAIGAIKALHQSRTMEGCSAPIVVKFADTQKEKDQKKMQQMQANLVGITALTTPPNGAITGMSATPANCLSSAAATALVPSPLTAASVCSNSSMSAALAAVTNPHRNAISNHASVLVPNPSVQPSLLAAAGSSQQTSPYLSTTDAMNASAAQLHIFQQLQAFGLHPAQYLQGLNFPPDHSVTTASLSNVADTAPTRPTIGATDASGQSNNAVRNAILPTRSISMQNLVTLATLGGHNYSPTQKFQSLNVIQPQQQRQQQHTTGGIPYSSTQALNVSTQTHAQMSHLLKSPFSMASPLIGNTTTALWPGGDSLTSTYPSALSPFTNSTSFAAVASPITNIALQAAAAGVAGKQVEGPEGSNLFIYHLPQEFTDTDLASTFLPFGEVLSAKVFIDKQTNLSKCFGFVSYDNAHSASAAIQAMHGFQIGTKRLKVQHKRSKDAAKPY